jgi:folate-binding protein YgfZ
MVDTETGTDHVLGTLRVSGADATDFLHNQLSVGLDGDPPAIGAWCDAKGRVRAVFLIEKSVNGWSLALPPSMVASVKRDLQVFILRSAVEISVGDSAPWDALASIRAGLPQVLPATAAKFLAPILNLDLVDGLSWSKGCYPGQGVINRAHHLGSNKRRCFRFRIEGPAPQDGAAVLADERQVGATIYSAEVDGAAELFAAVNLTALDADLTIEGRPVGLLDLPYAIPELGR